MKATLATPAARYSGAFSMLANPNLSPQQVQRGVSIIAGAAKKDPATNMPALADVISSRPAEQLSAVRANLRSHFSRVVVAGNEILKAQTQASSVKVHPVVAGFFASLTKA